jgi:hypothetical protein
MSLIILSGNLLEAPERYIGHQCNCVTAGLAAGLAKAVFARYPYADTYAQRKEPSEPGSYSMHGNGKDERYIVNFYAQYYPGKAMSRSDTKDERLKWLIAGMDRFVRERRPPALALPYGIGCGLAGGDWNSHQDALTKFADERDLNILLYRVLTSK